MRNCPNCGRALPPNARQCPLCGAPIACHAAPPSPAAGWQSRRKAPPSGPRYRPAETAEADGGLTTAQYFWTILLFSIPVAGLVFVLYWAFSGTAQPCRKRLARAWLIRAGVILAGILLVLAILAIIAAAVLAHMAYLPPEHFTPYMPAPDPFYDEFDHYFGGHVPYDSYDPYFEQAPQWGGQGHFGG